MLHVTLWNNLIRRVFLLDTGRRVYSVHLSYLAFMLCSINPCENKVSTDQYNMTISQAHLLRAHLSLVFLKLAAAQVQIFDWIIGSCHVNL